MNLLTRVLPVRLRPYAKTAYAVAGSVIGYLAFAYADAAWLPGLIGIASALGVYHAPNVDGQDA